MARLTQLQTNFTAGEITPRLYGRTDLDRYANAARLLTNAHAVVHGGAKRRAGTRLNAVTKLSGTRKSRLVPFVVSRDTAYILEVGHQYIRVFPSGSGALIADFVSPYTEAMLPELDWAQSADTMFIAHPSVPIQRLRRFTGPVFDLAPAPFTTTPFDEQGHGLAANVTLSAATVGTGRTAVASSGVFLPSDVGRQLVSGAGVAVVTGYTSPTTLIVTVQIAFSATLLLFGGWSLDVSPQAIVKPSSKDPVGATIELAASLTRSSAIALSAVSGSITVNSTTGIFVAGDVGKSIYADSGVALITAFTSATQVSATTSSDFIATSYARGGYGITDGAWRIADEGKFLRINGGLVKVTEWVSDSLARGTIIADLTSTVAAPPLAWSLESSVWSSSNGYPRTVTFHEQRLVAAGSTKYPQTVWGSRIGEYLDFTKGSNDDDSYSFTLATDDASPIGHLTSLRNLVLHTYGGEFSLQGGVEKPITPTNVRSRPESAHGSKGVRPTKIGKESVFVQRAGRKVRSMGFRYDFDGYAAPDLVVLAEHITAGGGVTELAYQQEPDFLLWCVRGDGALLSCTFDRDQSVMAWAKHFTDGAFESVATVPNGDFEEAWAIVRRTVNGAVVRYLEIFDDRLIPFLPGAPFTGYPPAPADVVYGCTVDSGLVIDNAAGQTVFSVPHLIGKTVDILADGAVQPSQVVDPSGNVTLTRPSFRTIIGLPFRSEIGLLTPEVGTGTGSAQGNSMRTSELTMKFLNTIGAQVFDGDGTVQDVPFRQLGTEVLDRPPEPFSGDVRIETLGWDRGRSEFTIVQDQPLPMHLSSVVRKFQVND
jgi:hypothetical protein